jgi:exodeoxyribonuclease V alpha subunit
VGIVLPDPAAGGELRAFFRGDDGNVRSLPPSRLPEHETAFAMTVHKSQGSEFRRLLLVLPSPESPVVTRELVYTAITRAREAAEVWYEPAAMRAAIEHRTLRAGGLREKLLGQ